MLTDSRLCYNKTAGGRVSDAGRDIGWRCLQRRKTWQIERFQMRSDAEEPGCAGREKNSGGEEEGGRIF